MARAPYLPRVPKGLLFPLSQGVSQDTLQAPSNYWQPPGSEVELATLIEYAGPPTTGNWQRGQLVYDVNKVLWICTGVTPFTWSQYFYDDGSQVYNVKAYGAKGDGTTDDTAAIQTAIDAAIAANGGIVFFPIGIYRISATLYIDGNFVYLQGIGKSRDFSDTASYPSSLTTFPPASAIVVNSSFPNGDPIIQFGKTTNTYMLIGGGVSGLLVSGNPGTPGDPSGWLGGDIIQQNNVHGVIVEKNVLESSNGRGVYGTCTISGGASDALTQDNLIRSLGNAGIYLDSGMKTNNNSVNNYISGVTNYGILDSDIYNEVRDNYIENVARVSGYAAGTGIYCEAVNGTLVRGNTVNGVDYHGIYVGSSHMVIEGNAVFAANASNQSNGSGIYIENTPVGVLVRNNDIYDPNSKMEYGIYANIGSGAVVSSVGNSIVGAVTAPVQWNGLGTFTAHFNDGYNPVGIVTVAVPASGTAVATAAYDRTFYITAASSGTTTVAISSGPTITIPASGLVAVFVPAGETLTPTYTSAPTWVVEGQ